MSRYFLISRLMGKVFLVSGLFLSIYGLAESSQTFVNISLGLLASGIISMGISFYFGLKLRGSDKGPSEWMGPRQ